MDDTCDHGLARGSSRSSSNSKQYSRQRLPARYYRGRGARWGKTSKGIITPSRVSNESFVRMIYSVMGAG